MQISDRLNDLEYSLSTTYCIRLKNTLVMPDVNKVQEPVLILITFIFKTYLTTVKKSPKVSTPHGKSSGIY